LRAWRARLSPIEARVRLLYGGHEQGGVIVFARSAPAFNCSLTSSVACVRFAVVATSSFNFPDGGGVGLLRATAESLPLLQPARQLSP